MSKGELSRWYIHCAKESWDTDVGNYCGLGGPPGKLEIGSMRDYCKKRRGLGVPMGNPIGGAPGKPEGTTPGGGIPGILGGAKGIG